MPPPATAVPPSSLLAATDVADRAIPRCHPEPPALFPSLPPFSSAESIGSHSSFPFSSSPLATCSSMATAQDFHHQRSRRPPSLPSPPSSRAVLSPSIVSSSLPPPPSYCASTECTSPVNPPSHWSSHMKPPIMSLLPEAPVRCHPAATSLPSMLEKPLPPFYHCRSQACCPSPCWPPDLSKPPATSPLPISSLFLTVARAHCRCCSPLAPLLPLREAVAAVLSSRPSWPLSSFRTSSSPTPSAMATAGCHHLSPAHCLLRRRSTTHPLPCFQLVADYRPT